MGMFLFVAGFVVSLVCGIIIIVKAFQVSVGWGLAVIFIPFASLFFVFNHWADTKKVFLVSVGGGALAFMGAISIASSPQLKDAVRRAEERRAASDAAQSRSSDSSASEERVNYASAAATPEYVPQRNTYEPAQPQPVTSYTPAYVPSYNPPAATAPAKTDTQKADDFDWRPKPVYEQVYVDRATMLFYAEKCRRKPENTYRIPRTVALKQGLTEAKCQ